MVEGKFSRLSIQYLIVEIEVKCFIFHISYLVLKKYLTTVKNRQQVFSILASMGARGKGDKWWGRFLLCAAREGSSVST